MNAELYSWSKRVYCIGGKRISDLDSVILYAAQVFRTQRKFAFLRSACLFTRTNRPNQRRPQFSCTKQNFNLYKNVN